MRKVLVKTLVEIADRDPRIVLMTADLGFMVLEPFAERFPKRFFNVGVAEANMIGLATGLASCGYVPYVYSIATFASMRGYEQIRNGPVFHKLKVRIIGVGGGFDYGAAGTTHHALEDFAIARVQPGLSVIAPADDPQAANALQMTYDIPGPIYYRLSKQDNSELPNLEGRFALGRAEIVREGKHLLIVSIGSICGEALKSAEILAQKGIEATVVVVSSLRPAPDDDLKLLLKRFPLVATIEEHYVCGGLGSLVSELAGESGAQCRIVRFGITDDVPRMCGTSRYLREQVGLTADAMAVRLVAESENSHA
jgi:transketolase